MFRQIEGNGRKFRHMYRSSCHLKQCGFLLGDHAFQSTTCFFLAIGAYTVSTFLADFAVLTDDAIAKLYVT